MKCKSIISILLSATFVAGTLTTPAFAAAYPSSASAKAASITASSADDFVIEDGVLVSYKGEGGAVTIPDGVISIGYEAFMYNDKITGVTIPSSVLTIEDEAFLDCTKLSSVTIPDTVTSIGMNAFSGTPWLNKYDKDLVVVGNGILIAYKGNAANVTITSNVKSIGPGTFYGNVNLEKIKFGDSGVLSSVTSIGASAFYECEGLTSIDIPAGVISIGEDAFSGCMELSKVSIPNTVMAIGRNAFEYTPWLDDHTGDFVIVGDSILISYSGDSLKVTIPDGVKRIAGGTFPDYMFSFGDGIISVKVPNTVIEFCDYAFSGCNDLTTINIPTSVTTIGENVFSGCTHLGSITIPSSVTSIGAMTFDGCASMTEIIVDSGNKDYTSQDGILFNIDKTSILKFPCGKDDNNGVYTIPDSVKRVEDSAFSECEELTSVTIPAGVTYIGDNAFYNCGEIKNITIPGSVLTIGYNAFSTCSSLDSVIIQEGVKKIGDLAFSSCEVLKSISIPSTLIDLGDNTFSGSISLIDVKLPDGLSAIGSGTFSGCAKLTTITLPAGLKTIGEAAFESCIKLTAVTLPNSLTSIGDMAFVDCQAIKSMSIPASVTKIGRMAFADCTGITEINVDAGNPSYISQGGVLLSKDSTTLIQYPSGKQGIYTIPGTVKIIGDYSFGGCEKLTGITIPSGVTKIGEYSFAACYGLKSVTIPNSVKTIGSCAFLGYDDEYKPSGLASVTIPNTVEKIGSSAFEGTTWLAKQANDFVVVGKGLLISYKGSAVNIVIPDNVKTICGSAFTSIFSGYFSGYQSASIIDIEEPTQIENVFIPGSVSAIDDEAFAYCESLESVTISNGVQSIGTGAFEMCDSLISINIPKSVTSIGADAFYYSRDVKIYCVSPSKALDYAKDNEIPYSIVNPVTSIKLNATSLNWLTGKSMKLVATITPTNATTKSVVWTTSDKKVATVDSNGLVKAISVGKAIITCTAKDGNGAKATCTVNVMPGTPANVKAASASYNSIKISWSAVSGASGYEVYRYNDKTRKYDKIKATTATSFTDTSLTINKSYSYIVRAYKTVNGANFYSNYSAKASTKPLPSIPGSFKVAKASKTSLKISWAAVTGATGYEVYRWSNATEKYVLIKTTTSLSYTNTGLKTNNSYSYKVRAYKTVNGVKYFGTSTAVKSAKPY